MNELMFYSSEQPLKGKTGGTCERLCNQNCNTSHPSAGVNVSQSIEMIYKNTVEKRTSSSSEEAMEISDKSIEPYNDCLLSGDGCIAVCQAALQKGSTQDKSPARGSMEQVMRRLADQWEHMETPKEKALRMVRDAE